MVLYRCDGRDFISATENSVEGLKSLITLMCHRRNSNFHHTLHTWPWMVIMQGRVQYGNPRRPMHSGQIQGVRGGKLLFSQETPCIIPFWNPGLKSRSGVTLWGQFKGNQVVIRANQGVISANVGVISVLLHQSPNRPHVLYHFGILGSNADQG